MPVDFEKIRELVEQRDKFLEEHPELYELQEQINKVLRDAGNDPVKRSAALQQLLLNSWWRITEI